MEIWKPIPEYEGLYEVSNLGRIKSLVGGRYGTGVERILKPRKTCSSTSVKKRFYFGVVLCKNKIKKNIQVHRIVALVFIQNTNNLPQVNHINNNPLDNRVENLEWVTNRTNCNHAATFRQTTSRHPGVYWNKRNKKWMALIRVNGKQKYLGYFINELDAANAYQTALEEIIKNETSQITQNPITHD